MSQWKFTDATNKVAFRVLEDGSMESRLASTVEGDIAPADAPVRDIKAEIAAMEFATLTGRGTREFMLSYFESNFTPEQLAANPGYVKAKALDNQIKALRTLL